RLRDHCDLPSFPTRRSSDLVDLKSQRDHMRVCHDIARLARRVLGTPKDHDNLAAQALLRQKITLELGDRQYDLLGIEHSVLEPRSEEHTSELQSRSDLVCRL